MIQDYRLEANRIIVALACAKNGVDLKPDDELTFIRLNPDGSLPVSMDNHQAGIGTFHATINAVPGDIVSFRFKTFVTTKLAFHIAFVQNVPNAGFSVTFFESPSEDFLQYEDRMFSVSRSYLPDDLSGLSLTFNTRDLLLDPSVGRFAPAMPFMGVKISFTYESPGNPIIADLSVPIIADLFVTHEGELEPIP